MKTFIPLFINKFFQIIILYQTISKTLCDISFEFPTAITLPNSNIFIIHKYAIDIYDSSLQTLINREWEFSKEDRISYEQYPKIVVKFQYGYILSIINDKINIFDHNGKFLYRGISNVYYTYKANHFYTLACLGVKNNEYYYIAGYISSNTGPLYLALYSYNIEKNTTEFLNSNKKKEFENYKFKNSLKSFYSYQISCEYMYYPLSNKNLLVCFVNTNNYDIISVLYEINIDSGLISEYNGNDNINNMKNITYDGQNDQIKIIRSSINFDRTLALVCYQRKDNRKGICGKFNITSLSFYDYTKFDKICELDSSYLFGLNVVDIKETNQIAFSCKDVSNNGSVQIQLYNKYSLEEDNPVYYEFLECSQMHGHSILFLNTIQKYYILSDVECKDGNYSFYQLNISVVNTIEENSEYIEQDLNDTEIVESTIIIDREPNNAEIMESTIIIEQELNNIIESTIINENVGKNEQNKNCDPIKFFEYICTIKDEISEKDKMTNEIRTSFLSENFYSYLLDKEKILVERRIGNIIYSISPLKSEINNNYISISNLDECGKLLKNIYNINQNVTLYMFIISIMKEGISIPLIEYEIYEPFSKTKMELNYCQNVTIKIEYNISINEDILFKYNSSDEYYNDKCYPYKTEYGTDIILDDRRNEFILYNMSLCEKNCNFEGYNTTSKKALCSCSIKDKFKIYSKVLENPDDLLHDFKNINTLGNIYVLKCYKLLFEKNGLKYNIGNYVLLFIILIHIISLIYFILKGYDSFYNKISELILLYENKNNNNLDNNNIKTQIQIEGKKIQDENNLKNRKIYNSQINEDNILNLNSKSNSKIALQSWNKSDKNIFKNITEVSNENNKIKKHIELTDSEMNSLDYNEALELDKRTYLQYYFSLLKTKHSLIFSFYTYNDYNSKVLKICLFSFSFGLYYTINGLFFTETIIHKIYEEYGIFNIINQIKIIIYSTIISYVFIAITSSLSLTEKNILEIKKDKCKNEKNKKEYKIIKCVIAKFTFYFLLSILFLLFFWFFLSCFCCVYINSQIHLIKDTLISFGLSLIYPLIIKLIPGLFRIPSLNAPNKDRKLMYKFSKLVQLL